MRVSEEIGRYIMVIHRQLKLFVNRSLKNYGINFSEAIVLIYLFGEDSVPQNNLITMIHHELLGKTQDQMNHFLRYDKSVMTRTMQSLEAKGYVIRKANPKDSRSYIFNLSERSLELMPVILSTFNRWNSALTKNIGKECLDAVKLGLSIMAENATNIMD